jgi:hypothetical protein
MSIADNCIIPAELAQSIEDAVLFGHIGELDSVLDTIAAQKSFPEDLRYGLEALRYFREHYGKDGPLEPDAKLQKQQVIVMESAWGSELLTMLHQQEAVAEQRYA